MSKLTDKLKRGGKNLFLFLTSKEFLLFIIKWIAFWGVLTFLIIMALKCYTRQASSRTVPDFSDMEISEVKKLARKKKLKVIVYDSAYIKERKPLVVLEQNPKAESRVKPNRSIYLVISKFNADKTYIPKEMYGMPLEMAEAKLRSAHLNYTIKERVFGDPANTVLKVYYKGDVIIDKNKSLPDDFEIFEDEAVELVVTNEEFGGYTNVPQCLGKTYYEAKFQLEAANLSIGSIISMDGPLQDTSAAYVVKQRPEAELTQLITIGSYVDLYLSNTPPAFVPDEVQPDSDDVDGIIDNDDFGGGFD